MRYAPAAVVRAPKPEQAFETVTCPLCGPYAASREIYRARDWMYPCEEWFGLRRCRRCGLIFVSPRPRPRELDDYYPGSYPAHVPMAAPRPRAHMGWKEQLRAVALTATLEYPAPRSTLLPVWTGHLFRSRMLRKSYPRWRPHGTLLDVGCGRGDFLLGMRQLGWKVFGLDPSARAVEIARSQGIPAAQCRLTELSWPEASVDAITFQDSFEHHPNPVETLRAAARLLRRNGSLIIRFPNFNGFWRWVFGPYWADIAVPRHLYHYTPATLRRMVQSCGFKVEHIHRLRTAEFSRSLQTWETAYHGCEMPFRSWARRLDHAVSFGHCLLRASRR